MQNIFHLKKSYSKISVIIVLAIVYFVGAKLGFMLIIPTTNVSPVWLASGIAFSSVMLFGYWVWPGIMLGEFVANLLLFSNITEFSVERIMIISFVHAVGCTLEPLLGVGIIKRKFENRNFYLNQTKHVFYFLVAAIAAGITGSIFGALTLGIADVIQGNEFSIVWVTWLIGDTTGIILIVPFIWACVTGKRFEFTHKKILETVLIFILLTIISYLIFAQNKLNQAFYVQPYYLLPGLIWAAFRLELRRITGAVLLICVFAVWNTTNGNGPFISNSLNNSLLSLQLFISIISVTMVILASAIAENKAANSRILSINKKLEVKVEDRVTELKSVNAELAKHKDSLQEMVDEKTLELQQKNMDIASKATELEEANITLKVLLKQREKDKCEFEEKILTNMNNLIFPHIQNINIESLDEKDQSAFTMISNGLNDIFSSFAARLHHAYNNLTPREIQVANLIAENKGNKEISDLLGVSVRSVETHRDNIRNKLNLRGKKVNLRNYLQSKT